MDTLISIFFGTLIAAILILLICKLMLFKNATSYLTLKRFLYFSTNSIYSSDTNKKLQAKILQNRISLIILLLILALLIGIKFIYLN